MQVLGLAEIQLGEDFSSEGHGNGALKPENVRNSCNFVNSTDLVVIWPNKFLSGEYRGKVVIIWSNLQVSRLLGRINFFPENFMFFAENGHLCLWVLSWRFDGNVKCDRTKFVQFVL